MPPFAARREALNIYGPDASHIAALHQSVGDLGGSATVMVSSLLWTSHGTQDTPPSGQFNNQPGLGKTVNPAGGTLRIDETDPDPATHNHAKNLNRELEIAPGASAVPRLGRHAGRGARPRDDHR